MKRLIFILTLLVSNNSFSQDLKESTIISSNFSTFQLLDDNPCSSEYVKNTQKANSKFNFLRLESCGDEDKSKLKGYVYCVIICNDTIYNTPLESINLFKLPSEEFLKKYKKLKPIEKLNLESNNRQENKKYYEILREETRKKNEETKRIEEEKKKIELEEIRKKELEKQEKIKAEKLIQDIEKAKNDSIIEIELRDKLSAYLEVGARNNKLIEQFLKRGKENGGILVSKFDFSINDFGTIDLTLGIKNVGSKRIKYVTFKLLPLNSVDDQADEEKSFKGIGYVEPNSDGEWKFKSAWFSDIIETLKLKSITIVYEDGSTKTISNNIGLIRIDEYESVINGIDYYGKEKVFRFDPLVIFSFERDLGDLMGLVFYSITSKELTSKTMSTDEIKEFMADLSQSIENLKNKVFEKKGMFETKYSSQKIYLVTEDGETVIDLKNAEQILIKLKEIYK
jgi:hypothetical protein